MHRLRGLVPNSDEKLTRVLKYSFKRNNCRRHSPHVACKSLCTRLYLYPSKCKELQSCFRRSPPTHSPVELDGLAFETVNSAKVLGVTIRDDFKWNDHISNVTSKAAKRLYLLSQLKRAGICASDLVLFYCSTIMIRSVLEYACQVFQSSLPYFLSEELERIQKRAVANYLSLCKLQQRSQRGRHPLSIRQASVSIV